MKKKGVWDFVNELKALRKANDWEDRYCDCYRNLVLYASSHPECEKIVKEQCPMNRIYSFMSWRTPTKNAEQFVRKMLDEWVLQSILSECGKESYDRYYDTTVNSVEAWIG